jgi:hypothetical protein
LSRLSSANEVPLTRGHAARLRAKCENSRECDATPAPNGDIFVGGLTDNSFCSERKSPGS